MTKWAIRAGLALAVLALVSFTGITAYVVERFHASRPVMSGALALDGLGGTARIARDANGVAHIAGESDADVFFALGFTHASERFFQMDTARRFVRGRLAELAGADLIAEDARTRTLGLEQLTQDVTARLSVPMRAAVEAYTAGVNARLAQGRPAPEYILLRARPEAWSVEDSAAMVVFLAHYLAMGADEDMERARLEAMLSPQRLTEFMTGYPDWAPVQLHDDDIRDAFGPVRVRPLPAPQDALSQADNPPGSNAWVVSGGHSATGRPLLANDPHLGLSTPSMWYLTRLELSNGPVIGASLPGAPFIVLGRNAHGAWGFTNTGFDVIDHIARPRDGLETTGRTEIIHVRGRRDPVEITVKETPEGPVLDPAWFDLSGFPSDTAVVRRSVVTHPDNRVADGVFAIMQSTGWEDFVEAGRGWTAPMQNMLYAGVDGTTGYATAGLLPLRDEDGDWTGFIAFEDLPRIVNPRGGVIVSANNKIASDAYPFPLPGQFDPYRAARIESLLAERELHDIASFKAMQMDVTSEHARRLLPVLLSATPESQLGVSALARLERWDGTLDADGPEGLIFSAWLRVLSAAIWMDELGPAGSWFVQPRRVFLDEVLTGEASHWCDDVRTDEIETCAVTAGLALDAAMAETAALFGRNIDAWRWGEAHQARFAHPLSDIPVFGRMFETRTPVPGDGSTVNVHHFSYASGNYDSVHAANFRAVYDLADLNRSRFMTAPGQSGHPLSPHFRDLAERWAAGESFEIRDDWSPSDPPEGVKLLTLTGR
ncbi:penicillin acylase family protein [Alkalicaulis satelles]|nr:penicillin acylase family protein [Alkalicaulis satelles]